MADFFERTDSTSVSKLILPIVRVCLSHVRVLRARSRPRREVVVSLGPELDRKNSAVVPRHSFFVVMELCAAENEFFLEFIM